MATATRKRSTSLPSGPLAESFRQGALRVDREQSVIRGVKVLGTQSRNRRRYLAEATADCARLLREGVPVAFGHHDDRDYQDRNGQLRSGEVRDDGAYADWHLNPKHPLTEQVLWDAEHCPSNLALSIEVPRDSYESRFARDGIQEIQRIHRLPDVAVVAAGGTNRSLFESEDATMSEIKTISDLRENYPELCDKLLAESHEDTTKDKLIEQQKKELADATSKIEALEKAQRESDEKQRRDQRRGQLREKAVQEKVTLTDKLLERLVPADISQPCLADDVVTDLWESLPKSAAPSDEGRRGTDAPHSKGGVATASGSRLAATKSDGDVSLFDALLATRKK